MKNEAIDLKAEEVAVANLLNKLYAAWDRQDVPTMVSLLTEDVLFCGNGPSEIYNKQQITEGWTQMLAQPFKLDFIDKPIIRIAPNGQSAVTMQQYFMPAFSTKIPLRNGYHLIKINDNWLIFTCNSCCAIKDEDFPKINEVLSQ
jgi:uncharacterized protein (TIGR02246 family)